ncbi:uncharacterized protein LOC112145636 [Oryzias melastigma]|uniref:uncharacterized protein LOC112145636 n=1 Tax=Oryzias melastigma TaxID=30732 RepID=UPI000CF7D3F1|nr:uncharacterized protein LOC112145636 [Oryzias melastigma]
MSFAKNPTLVLDKGSLPLKKRDQRLGSKLQQQQQQCEAANFKVPYPHRSHGEVKMKPTGPFRPVPRRVPALHQPWMQTSAPASPKHLIPSAFREHHGWAEWRDFNPISPGWDFPRQNQHHFHTGQPLHSCRFSSVSLVSDGFHRAGGSWEKLKSSGDKSLNLERHSYDKHKGPYVRQGDRKFDFLPKEEKSSPPLLGRSLPPHEDLTLQEDSVHKAAKALSSPQLSLRSTSPPKVNRSYTAMTESPPADVPPLEQASPCASSASRFPWLLPHFMAGSLIELRDGRLRRVEHLQTEDFLLGSLACPDLRLSCCTVQSISPPDSSASSVSRLLILLHEQQSQELVDVYVEYPFFVRGQGWSSCSPQRTARLCGLQCRQLSVGDVCLALTPVSPPLSATAGLKVSPGNGKCIPLGAQASQLSKGPMMRAEAGRRRHYSAP